MNDEPFPRFLRQLADLLQELASDLDGDEVGSASRPDGNGAPDPPVRGPRQRQIVDLLGMNSADGLRNREIADAINYDQPNVWSTLRVLENMGIVEQVPRPGPQRWRLTSQYRSHDVAQPDTGRSDVTASNTRPFAGLEAQFQDACDAAVEECRQLQPPYIPKVWINLSRELGAAEAARRLVVSADIQTGFDRLVKAGRADLTVEWALLSPTWQSLFSDQHREAARWRLTQAGIAPPH